MDSIKVEKVEFQSSPVCKDGRYIQQGLQEHSRLVSILARL